MRRQVRRQAEEPVLMQRLAALPLHKQLCLLFHLQASIYHLLRIIILSANIATCLCLHL
jgi:hypothetical protein